MCVEDFPRLLVLPLPPLPPWGSDSTRRTRCKLSRSQELLALLEPRPASVSACPALCLFPLPVFSELVPRAPLRSRFLPESSAALPRPGDSPTAAEISRNSSFGGVCSNRPQVPSPGRGLPAAPRTQPLQLRFYPGRPAVHSRALLVS